MTSESLYVIRRTFPDLKDPAGVKYNVAIPATFTDLHAAKAEAKATLFNEGYEKNFFEAYDVNNGQQDWSHDDGTIVYAKGPSGENFRVDIDIVPNEGGLEGNDDGRVRRPLHHVLQTNIHYNEDRSGSIRDSTVESTHTARDLARAQALKVLLDESVKKDDFIEYDEYNEDTENAWGDDVVVHAVKEGGENILVSVVSDYHV